MASVRVVDVYPLTPMQQGMLYHSVVDDAQGIYCEQVVIELPASTDLEAWEEAFRSLVAAHSILRTAFEWEDLSRPVHVEQSSVELRLDRRDWTAVPDDEFGACLEAFMDEDRRRGFDFARPPLLRLTALSLSGGCTNVVLTFHHILLDGWSLSLLMRELEMRYQAPALALERPRPFRDFIAWLLQSAAQESAEAWRAELASFEGPLPFPPPRRDGSARPEFAEVYEYLDAAQTAALGSMAASHGLTLNTVVQGAWALALAGQSGVQDVVFGATVSGRPAALEGVETMVGMFINTLPVRARIDSSASVGHWLGDLQKRHASLRDRHEHTPLAMIQQWSGVNREYPLFETVVVFENFPSDSVLTARNTHGWSARIRPQQITNYPVHLLVVPAASLLLHVTFDRTRVNPEVMRRMLHRTANLLSAMATSPEVPLGRLPSVTPDEQEELIRWSTRRSGSAYQEVSTRFREQVAKTPHAVAVAHNGRQIDYEGLERRANEIAAVLVDSGLPRESVVALCAPRGIDYLAAVLGILRAGCAYLPVDPSHPKSRNDVALQRAGTRLVLIDGEAATVPHWAPMLRLHDVTAAAEPVPPRFQSPSHLAYVIFTSGSTGTPKGVMVTHGGMWNHLLAKLDCLALRADDVVAQNAPQGFDISIWQMLAALLVGGRVQIYDDDVARDPGRLLDRMEADGVTILELVPSLLRLLPEEARHRPAFPTLDRLRFVMPTGEALPPETCFQWFATWPRIPLVNAYGPTECSDDVTHHVMAGPPPESVVHMPIGRPIPGARVYILDSDLRPAPPGVAGELCVGGSCVGRGYVAEPGLTAAAFVPDPFSGEAGARLYRTGDGARFLDDGTLEYRGRLDTQIKLHGNRIELGEIEHRLGRLVSGRAVVMLRRTGDEPRLVAYVERGTVPWSADELRRALGEWLPASMVPASIVFPERFPLTPNGKIDRSAMPTPAPAESRRAGARNDMERRLIVIWRDLLQLPHVGVNDNFFEVGGDSIRSIQLVARARRNGVLLKQRDVFRHQTIAELARVAQVVDAEAKPDAALHGEVPLTPMQRWFFEQRPAHPSKWHLTVTVESRRELDPALLEAAVHATAAHHDALRLRLRPNGTDWIQSLEDPKALFKVGEHDAAAMDASVIRDAAAALVEGLDMHRGPMIAVALLKTRGASDRVVLVVHHLCADVISMQWLLEDLEDAYVALESGRVASLVAPATSFSAWARAVNSLARTEEFSLDREFWSTSNGRHSRTPPAQREALLVDILSLPRRESRTLLEELPVELAATVEDLLLTAMTRALTTCTGRTEWVVDIEHHGRNEIVPGIDVTRTVGLFTTTFPVFVGINPAEAPTRTLRTVKEVLRVPRHGLGWGVLRFVERDPVCCAHPPADLRFNYLGRLDGFSRATGLFKLETQHLTDVQNRFTVGQWLVDLAAFADHGTMRLHVTMGLTSAIAARFVEGLRHEIDALVRREAFDSEPVYLPSDFPRANLDEVTLRRVLFQAGQIREEERC
jgi:amino acid adenylation domain-containing protein/non-ribosomal peptide synthase protein (TIGR01720 family)